MSNSWILEVVEQSKPRKCLICSYATLRTFLDSISAIFVLCVDVLSGNYFNILLNYIDTNQYNLFFRVH